MYSNDSHLFFLKVAAWLLHYFAYIAYGFVKLVYYRSNNLEDFVQAPQSPRTIVITGASQGLGEALVEHYYRYVASVQRIILISRNKEKLDEIQARLNFNDEKQILLYVCDVTNRNQMKTTLHEIHRLHGEIDVLLVNAGVSFRQTSLKKGFISAVEETFDVNIIGAINTVLPLIEMNGVRQIGLVCSQAAYAPVVSPVYGASKQCLVSFGHDLRRHLAKDNVAVNIISPGPIKTPMLVGSYKKSVNLGVPTKKAAQIIVDGLQRNQIEIVFPDVTGIFQYMLSYLPRSVAETVSKYVLRN